jgi:K+-transporting ATPase A subunit
LDVSDRPGPNLEGEELRFGDPSSALSVTVATDTSSGGSNVADDSLMPLATFVALANMQIGDVVFGQLSTTTPLLGALLLATVLVVTALTFVPADALGPIAEQLLLQNGRSFYVLTGRRYLVVDARQCFGRQRGR